MMSDTFKKGWTTINKMASATEGAIPVSLQSLSDDDNNSEDEVMILDIDNQKDLKETEVVTLDDMEENEEEDAIPNYDDDVEDPLRATDEDPNDSDEVTPGLVESEEQEQNVELRQFLPDARARFTSLDDYRCYVCGKDFTSFTFLAIHRRSDHTKALNYSEVQDPFACGICGQSFTTPRKALACAVYGHDPATLIEAMFIHNCPLCPEDTLGHHSLGAVAKHWGKSHPSNPIPAFFLNVGKGKPDSFPRIKITDRQLNQVSMSMIDNNGKPLVLDNIPKQLQAPKFMFRERNDRKKIRKRRKKNRQNNDSKLQYVSPSVTIESYSNAIAKVKKKKRVSSYVSIEAVHGGHRVAPSLKLDRSGDADPNECWICGLSVKHLQKHINTHNNLRYSGNPRYKCCFCNREYNLQSSFYSHKMRSVTCKDLYERFGDEIQAKQFDVDNSVVPVQSGNYQEIYENKTVDNNDEEFDYEEDIPVGTYDDKTPYEDQLVITSVTSLTNDANFDQPPVPALELSLIERSPIHFNLEPTGKEKEQEIEENSVNDAYNYVQTEDQNEKSELVLQKAKLEESDASYNSCPLRRSQRSRANKTDRFSPSLTHSKIKSEETDQESNRAKQKKATEAPLSTDPEELYECVICMKIFYVEDKLHRHMKLHLTPTETHPCEVCKKPFSTIYNLRRHIKILHKIKRKKVAASNSKIVKQKTDTRGSATAATASRSKKSEINDKEMQDLVTKNVSTPSASAIQLVQDQYKLHRHMNSNLTPTATHRCEVCQKSFSTDFNLRRHMKDIHKIKSNGLSSKNNKQKGKTSGSSSVAASRSKKSRANNKEILDSAAVNVRDQSVVQAMLDNKSPQIVLTEIDPEMPVLEPYV